MYAAIASVLSAAKFQLQSDINKLPSCLNGSGNAFAPMYQGKLLIFDFIFGVKIFESGDHGRYVLVCFGSW